MQAVVRTLVLLLLAASAALAPAGASAQQYYDPNNPPQYPPYPPYPYYDPGQGQYGYPYSYPPYGYPPYGYGAYGYPPYSGYGYGYPPYGYNPYSYYGYYGYSYPYGGYPYGAGQYGYSYSPYGYGAYSGYGYSPYGYGYGAPYSGWSPYYPTGGYLPPAPPYGTAGNPCYGGGALTLNVTQTGNQALLSWTPYPGAQSYNLLQGVNGAPPTLLKNIPAGGTSDIEYLQPGNTYVWQLQAIVGGVPAVTSPPTQPISATPMTYTGVTSGIPSPTLSRIVAAQLCASVAGGTTVTVQVRDTNNLPMINQPVWVQAMGPGAIVTPNQLTTDYSGNTPPFSVRAQYPGPVQITASVNGVPIQPPVTIYFQ